MSLGLTLGIVALLWLGSAINSSLVIAASKARRNALLAPLLALLLSVFLAVVARDLVLPLWLALLLLLAALGIAAPLALRVRRAADARRRALRRSDDWAALTAPGHVRGEVQRSFAADQVATFAFLSHPGQAPRWRGVADVQGLLDAGLQVGSTWKQIAESADGKTSERTFRMLIWDPPSRCAWQAQGDARAAVWTLECRAQTDGSTQVVLGQTFDPPWLYAAASLLLPDRLTGQIDAQLSRYLRQAALVLEPAAAQAAP